MDICTLTGSCFKKRRISVSFHIRRGLHVGQGGDALATLVNGFIVLLIRPRGGDIHGAGGA